MRDFDLSPYARSTVGFDHLFNLMERAADASSGYPPYNIERSDDTHYRITLAVAGFQEKDLSVETREGVLFVAGQTEEKPSRTISTAASPDVSLNAVSSWPNTSRCAARSWRTAFCTSNWSA